jgi:hypothetical protein
MKFRPLTTRITPTGKIEKEIEDRLKEIIEGSQNTIAHYDSKTEAEKASDGDIVSVDNKNDTVSLYRKINGKLLKVV